MSLFSSLRAAALAVALLLSPAAWAQVAFSSDFDTGNGRAFTQTGPASYDWLIEDDSNSNDQQWWSWEVSGAEGQTLTFRLADTSTNVSSHWNDSRPVFSTDGGQTWDRISGNVFRPSGSSWAFTHSFGADDTTVRFAFHYPYTIAMLNEKLAQWQDHPHTEHEILGSSVQGRPIHYFRLTDPTVPDDGKLGIWITARQHAAEVTGSFSVEALMDSILADDAIGRALRSNAIFHVAPMMNPDGNTLGNYRDNAQGINLNRVWDGSANMTNSPEVRLVQDRLDQTVAAGDGDYVLFIDFHSTAALEAHFVYRPSTSLQPPLYPDPANYSADARRLVNLVNQYAPFLDNSAGLTSGANTQLAYHSQREAYGVLALTPEGTYSRHYHGPTPNAWLTPEDHRQVGTAFARAIVDYYELEPIELQLDEWMMF